MDDLMALIVRSITAAYMYHGNSTNCPELTIAANKRVLMRNCSKAQLTMSCTIQLKAGFSHDMRIRSVYNNIHLLTAVCSAWSSREVGHSAISV